MVLSTLNTAFEEGRFSISPRSLLSFISSSSHSLIRQFFSKKEDEENIWCRPSGWNCGRKRAFQRLISEGKIQFAKETFSLKNTYKFLFGDLIEHSLIALIRGAGFPVSHTQYSLLTPLGVGHPDGVISLPSGEKVLLEIKSMDPFSFNRTMNDEILSDTFGYRTQYSSYIVGLEDEGILPSKEGKCVYLFVNKLNGTIGERIFRADYDLISRREGEREEIDRADSFEDLKRGFQPADKKGILQLDVACSYCPFKYPCWEGDYEIREEEGRGAFGATRITHKLVPFNTTQG